MRKVNQCPDCSCVLPPFRSPEAAAATLALHRPVRAARTLADTDGVTGADAHLDDVQYEVGE